ncbi:DUF1549 domain-containing protein [Blastopirellula marina]|uniref:DUF1553 domain-containing protein n=1 Tax=Blastopirellula marina DSM 3645 TaxID=314230 RepID=A3ZMG6_9BACT|nr:DUF1549 domain-containing protein [Blastopirellula marina]EAQ82139.1 hypothetical protein DSM3645_00455 [Blastopirellula marina DSM 3645]
MTDRKEPLIDSLLDELFQQKSPPDLTARILAQLHSPTDSAQVTPSQNGAAHPAPISAPIYTAALQATHPPVDGPASEIKASEIDITEPVASRSELARRRTIWARRRQWIISGGMSIALMALVAFGAWVIRGNQLEQERLAREDAANPLVTPAHVESPINDKKANDDPVKPSQNVPSPPLASNSQPPAVAPLMPANTGPVNTGPANTGPANTGPANTDKPQIAANNTTQPSQPEAADPRPQIIAEPIPTLAKNDAQVVTEINDALAAAWKDAGVKPTGDATPEEWCRRVYLRLLGRIPSVEEIKHFASQRGRDRDEKLVNEILYGEQHRDELAQYWGSRLANTLIGRAAGMSDGSDVNRAAFERYLGESVTTGKSYDALARELLTAAGSNQPSAADYNPAVNFLGSLLDQDATLATAKTCQVFLGRQAQCSQCHNHPWDAFDQRQYWQLNAFFRQSHAEKGKESFRVVDKDYAPPGDKPEEGFVYFERNNGVVDVAYPQFPGAPPIPPSGRISDVNRRDYLAQYVTHSDMFAEATVNRMWQHFFGVGFTPLVDDMGKHNPPSHPELLSQLSGDFAASGFDLKRLMRWMALSDAFQLSSQTSPDQVADQPYVGRPLFTHYYSRQMEAEQLYQSLEMVAQSRRAPALIADPAARHQWLGQFAREMGDDEGSVEHALEGSYAQSLEMMNGRLMEKATRLDSGVLKSVINSNMSPSEKIDHLFLAALARKPNGRERKAIGQILTARQDEMPAALQDVWWALLNSNEFLLDH